jgi:hypothetical protein
VSLVRKYLPSTPTLDYKNMTPPMSNDDNNGDHTPPSAARGGGAAAASRSSLTPTRPTNNYAAINTPIASAKRSTKKHTPVPSSAKKTLSSSYGSNNGGGGGGGSGAPKTPIRTPKTPNNDTATATSSKHKEVRYANLSPMHNVKAVPRDSHHVVPKVKRVEQDEETITDSSTICSIPATESTLSIVTEAPDVATASTSSSFSAAVGRKVDALFSPVLSFLNGASASGVDGEEEVDGGEKLANSKEHGGSAKASVEKEKKNGERKSDVEEEEVQNMVREALRQVRERERVSLHSLLLSLHTLHTSIFASFPT